VLSSSFPSTCSLFCFDSSLLVSSSDSTSSSLASLVVFSLPSYSNSFTIESLSSAKCPSLLDVSEISESTPFPSSLAPSSTFSSTTFPSPSPNSLSMLSLYSGYTSSSSEFSSSFVGSKLSPLPLLSDSLLDVSEISTSIPFPSSFAPSSTFSSSTFPFPSPNSFSMLSLYSGYTGGKFPSSFVGSKLSPLPVLSDSNT